jgi:hypothetical protein
VTRRTFNTIRGTAVTQLWISPCFTTSKSSLPCSGEIANKSTLSQLNSSHTPKSYFEISF